jgi:hypothetical protein
MFKIYLVLNIILMKNFEFKGFMKYAMPAIQENFNFKPCNEILANAGLFRHALQYLLQNFCLKF